MAAQKTCHDDLRQITLKGRGRKAHHGVTHMPGWVTCGRGLAEEKARGPREDGTDSHCSDRRDLAESVRAVMDEAVTEPASGQMKARQLTRKVCSGRAKEARGNA